MEEGGGLGTRLGSPLTTARTLLVLSVKFCDGRTSISLVYGRPALSTNAFFGAEFAHSAIT